MLLTTYLRFSKSNERRQLWIANAYTKRLNLLYIKIVLDKIKQLLGLLLSLHRKIWGVETAQRGSPCKHLTLYELFQY